MSEEHKRKLWFEKYRPKTIDEYVFHDSTLKASVGKMIDDRNIPHLILSGVQGSGKSLLSEILVSELEVDDTDIMVINGSDENSVDDMRTKIRGFITTFAMGDFKVVRIEEADYLSLNAQAVLRNMLEGELTDHARFIFTCNYENKIMPAIKSRCQHFRFKAGDKIDITEYAAKILMEEHVNFNIDTLDKFVSVGYPDVRKIVNLLQQNTINGELHYPTDNEAGDYKFQLLDLIARDKWLDARLLCCENVVAEEWEGVYRFLYENLSEAPKFQDTNKYEAGLVVIADRLYKHGIVADPEINAAAMFIDLSRL